eukprot:921813_1
MTLSEQAAIIVGCIIGSFIVIIFGLLLWYFCADTPHEIEPDYSPLHPPTKTSDDTDQSDITIMINGHESHDDDAILVQPGLITMKSSCEAKEEAYKSHYLIVSIDKCESDSDQPLETRLGVFFDSKKMDESRSFFSDKSRSVDVGYCKRFPFLQKDLMPQTISIKNLCEPLCKHESHATFPIATDLDHPNNCDKYSFRQTVKIDEEPSLLVSIGIDYTQQGPFFSKKLRKCNDIFQQKTDRDQELVQWFDSNKRVLFSLRKLKLECVPLTDESFADVVAPSHRLTEDGYSEFMRQYKTIHRLLTAKDGTSFKAYYEDDHDYLYYSNDMVELGGYDVTVYVLLLWRYVFLDNVLLKGQDAEFNIYRSYYFDQTE